MSPDPVIELSQVSFSWPKNPNPTLMIDNFSVLKGEHLYIKGSSGSGKTTLLNLLTGITTPQEGSVSMLQKPFSSLNGNQRDRFRADHLGVVFQQFNLLPYLSLLENVTLPCRFSKKRREKAGRDLNGEARRLLEHLDISGSMLHLPVSRLSVGQQQRVAVARALIGAPEIIIADEPTSALDSDNRSRFLELLFKESDLQGSTLLFVSHDPYIADAFSRVVELSQINGVTV